MARGLSLVLTHACNLVCTYCSMGEHHRTTMSFETAARALDLVLARGDDVDVSFFGGEPLLEMDLLVRVARYAIEQARDRDHSLRMQTTTNGMLLGKDRLEVLADLGVHVTLSFDGVRSAHDAGRRRLGGQSSFDAVLEAAKLLAASPQGLDVVLVVTPQNVRRLGESVRFLAGLGASRIHVSPAFEAGFEDDDLAAWERELEDLAAFWAEARRMGRSLVFPLFDNPVIAAVKGAIGDGDRCGAGARRIAVAPSGRVYPCDRLVGDDRDPRLAIGDVHGDGLDEMRAAKIRPGPAHPECLECPERFRCGAHCACANVAETGEPHLAGPIQCWHEQTRAALADRVAHDLLDERSEAFIAWAYGAGPTNEARRPLPVLRGRPPE